MKEKLKKEIDLEIQWLRYYGLKEDRVKLDLTKGIYEQIRSIGYTKRVIPLDLRCIGCLSYRPFSFDEISRILSKREFKGVDHHEER